MLKNKTFTDGKWTLALEGDIDIYNIAQFKETMTGLKGANVDVDFAEVSFIDSTGIGTLVSTLSENAKSGNKVRFINLPPYIYRVFKLTNLDLFFELKEAN